MSGWQLAANLPVLEEAWAGGAHSGVVSNEKQWYLLGHECRGERSGVEIQEPSSGCSRLD